jgi:two-component system response regulator RegX3
MTVSRGTQPLTIRGVRLDPAARTVRVPGGTFRLTGQEMRLLQELMSNAGHVLSIEYLLKAVWATDNFDDPRTLKVHVMRLRKKIEPNPHTPSFIRTVRGHGYIFDREPVAG